ncbi:hypothetical protein RhiirC2_797668 [Rhizophagus irregularis]|uniref:Uncharacterized protein n=1 Tax=Rhizophagus irregularis TaxID=588596 RepID=A0A2N1M7M7_9GLOM|nr:hypothetical protein RhiirC2_797668 [Rhizophagus irregularis]
MNIWKKCNEKWKFQRDLLGLTKTSFKEYSQNFRNNVSSQSSPRNNRRLELKSQKDFLFILFSSSNFLHSGSFFTHLEANDTITYDSPSYTDISLFYNLPAPSSGVLLEQSTIYNH